MTAYSRDDLIARAQERADAPPTPEGWGYRIVLEEGDAFVGRWRGETTDADNEDRRIYLFWDEDGGLCFSRTYAALEREIDRARPQVGATVALVRGKDYAGQQGTGYSFGVETEPNDDPLPDDGATNHIPF
jgi:hypothetical protein